MQLRFLKWIFFNNAFKAIASKYLLLFMHMTQYLIMVQDPEADFG